MPSPGVTTAAVTPITKSPSVALGSCRTGAILSKDDLSSLRARGCLASRSWGFRLRAREGLCTPDADLLAG